MVSCILHPFKPHVHTHAPPYKYALFAKRLSFVEPRVAFCCTHHVESVLLARTQRKKEEKRPTYEVALPPSHESTRRERFKKTNPRDPPPPSTPSRAPRFDAHLKKKNKETTTLARTRIERGEKSKEGEGGRGKRNVRYPSPRPHRTHHPPTPPVTAAR